MKRIALASLAAVLTSLFTAVWAAPVSATAAGQCTLQPGTTVTASKMDINACDANFAFFLIFDANGNQIASPNLGNNAGSRCSDTELAPASWTNTSGHTQTVKLRLDDTTCSALLYDSDGGGAANHATVSGDVVSINDAGAACDNAHNTSQPRKSHGNFNAALIFK